jgi:hypothetical protein
MELAHGQLERRRSRYPGRDDSNGRASGQGGSETPRRVQAGVRCGGLSSVSSDVGPRAVALEEVSGFSRTLSYCRIEAPAPAPVGTGWAAAGDGDTVSVPSVPVEVNLGSQPRPKRPRRLLLPETAAVVAAAVEKMSKMSPGDRRRALDDALGGLGSPGSTVREQRRVQRREMQVEQRAVAAVAHRRRLLRARRIPPVRRPVRRVHVRPGAARAGPAEDGPPSDPPAGPRSPRPLALAGGAL